MAYKGKYKGSEIDNYLTKAKEMSETYPDNVAQIEENKKDIDELKKKTEPITNAAMTGEEEFVIEDNAGNVLARITPEGSDFKNLNNNGKEVVVYGDDNIEKGSGGEEEEEFVIEIGGKEIFKVDKSGVRCGDKLLAPIISTAAKRMNYFSISVHTDNPFNGGGNKDVDYCVLMLPTNYQQAVEPVKLVVFCHGSGEPVYSNSSSLDNNSKKLPASLFCACGYAVLCVNGLPKKYSDNNGLSYGRPVGNWMATESNIKAVEKVCREYNIDKDNIFVYGESQGGMVAMNYIENSPHPIKACVLDSPAISMKFHQLNISGVLPNILHFYGFNDLSKYDESAVQGLDPYARNCTIIEDATKYTLNGNTLFEGEAEKIKSTRYSKTPTKFFLGTQDTLTKAYVTQIVAKQMKNGGQFVEDKLYDVGHCVDQNSETIGKINIDGKEFQVTQPMVEMIEWFSHFGGYDMISLI